ncbi:MULTISPECIES: hypothetical protein [Corallincola]|uniref:Uncharacterized protein n=2 Tax=Corallincola TaxID=1775176 RepID=A0A368NPC7_9GAMM|nr:MULTISPECIES: hypothetical protein [Corallincola]RCU51715.1 hypothetical protein DU002_04385 [Corallincola holothuriorum]TAA47212.1 hypothetical protein EXY25_08200 [Corallincola spongiicola]
MVNKQHKTNRKIAQSHSPAVIRPKRSAISMHEGVADWCDCCVCEAEPYWAEVADELGISLSDYEDDGV